MIAWDNKDPDEVLDYTIDWEARLDGDTIATSAWTLPSGLSSSTDSNDDTTTTVRLAGGTAETKYTIKNRITTTDGRTMDESAEIFVRER